jgi:pyrrolidone-carboxylate peptidase
MRPSYSLAELVWEGGERWGDPPYLISHKEVPSVLLIVFASEYFLDGMCYDFANPSWLVGLRVEEIVEKLKLPLYVRLCELPTALEYEVGYGITGPPAMKKLLRESPAQYQDIAAAISESLWCDLTAKVSYQVALVLGAAPWRSSLTIEDTTVPYWRLPGDPTFRSLPGLRWNKVYRSTLPNHHIIQACHDHDILMHEGDTLAGEKAGVDERPTSCNAAIIYTLDTLAQAPPPAWGGGIHVKFTPEQVEGVKRQTPKLASQKNLRGVALDTQAQAVIVAIVESLYAQGYRFDGISLRDLYATVDQFLHD